jgi:hypothetical protein
LQQVVTRIHRAYCTMHRRLSCTTITHGHVQLLPIASYRSAAPTRDCYSSGPATPRRAQQLPLRRRGTAMAAAGVRVVGPDHVVIRSADPVASAEWWSRVVGLSTLRVRLQGQIHVRFRLGAPPPLAGSAPHYSQLSRIRPRMLTRARPVCPRSVKSHKA